MAFIRNVDKLIEGLENKFFTEARAKQALAPELAAEESARSAADAAESAARQSADSAMDQRLQVVEGSGEGSIAKAEQDAKEYADQKIAALVNSAPEVLDTLKELSDALGGDENFATSVSNNIGAVDAKVDQEISDRQAAISSEQSARIFDDQGLSGRLDVLESDPTTKTYVDGEVSSLQSALNQEVSDRESAISGEQSARQLADSNLSDRIGVLEQDPTTKEYVDSEISDLQGQLTQEVSDRQADVDTEEARALAAEGLLDGRLVILENDPTTKTYVDGEVSDLQDQLTQEISDRQSDVGEEESRALSAESVLSGRLDVLESDPVTKTYVDGEVSDLQGQMTQEISDRQADVNAEEQRAMQAESALGVRVDGEISARQSAVSNEQSRAMQAESALDGRLDELESDPVTKTYVNSEVTDLQEQLDSEISARVSAVSAEQSARQAADNNLQGQVDTEKGRIDAILSASEADKDSFAEIVQLINSVDTENDQAFAGYVLSNNEALAQEISDRQSAVSAEQSRAEAAEEVLTSDLAQEVLNRQEAGQAFETALQQLDATSSSALSTEQSRAEGAESALSGRLDVLESDPTTKTYVDGQMSSEQSARQSADSALDSRLDIFEDNSTISSTVNAFGELAATAPQSGALDITAFGYSAARYAGNNGTAFGSKALRSATGSSNTAIGSNSCYAITTGTFNTAVGSYSLSLNTTGSSNTAIGRNSQFYALGSRNTAIGFESLMGTATFSSNDSTAVGFRALNKGGGGTNVSVGCYSLLNATTGYSNVCIGNSSGTAITAGTNNIFLGIGSGSTMTDAHNNLLIGPWVNASSPTASNEINIVNKIKFSSTASVSINPWTGPDITAYNAYLIGAGINSSGGDGVQIGAEAGKNSTGYASVMVGHQAGLNATSGSGNIFVGKSAGYTTTTGYDNIIIGYEAVASSQTASNEINIGNVYKATSSLITLNNDVEMVGGQKVKYDAKSADYTLVASDYIVSVSDLSAIRTMTLPSASLMGAGKTFIIKDQTGAASQSNYIRILPQSGQLIDGQSDYKIVMPYESLMVVSNGTHWFII